MSTPSENQVPEQVAAPTVSTAPGGTSTPPPSSGWWRWKALPDHLGRARTSTVILSVLFLAIFTLYLNVRPPVESSRTSPAGGGSDVVAPTNPLVPTEEAPTDPTEDPAPTTEPEDTETPEEETETPTTGSTPSSSSPGTTEPSTGPSDPTGTSESSGTTEETTEPSTPASPTTQAP